MNPKAGLDSIRGYLSNLSHVTNPVFEILADVEALMKEHSLKSDSHQAIYDIFIRNQRYECAAAFAKRYNLGPALTKQAALGAVGLYFAPGTTAGFLMPEVEELCSKYDLDPKAVYDKLILAGHEDFAEEFAREHLNKRK